MSDKYATMLAQGAAIVGGNFIVGGDLETTSGWDTTTLDITAINVPVNEVQTITVTADAGTFTLEFDGETTGAIAYNASAATVEAALEALDNLVAADVAVTGSAGGPWTVTFGGDYAGTNVPELVGDATLLTQGTGTAVPSTTTPGAAGESETQTITVNATGGVFSITYDGQTTADLDFNVSAGDMQTALLGLSTIADDGLTVAGGPGDDGGTTPYTVTWRADLGSLPELFTTNPAGLTGGAQTANVAQGNAGSNPTQEVQEITVTAGGGTFTITYSGQTTSALAYNANAAAVEAALEALSNLEPNEIAVSGGPGDETGSTPYVLTFGSLLGNVGEVTCDDALLYEEGGLIVEATPTPGEGTGTDPTGWTVACRYTRVAAGMDGRVFASNDGTGDNGEGTWFLELPYPVKRGAAPDAVLVGVGYLINVGQDGNGASAYPIQALCTASQGATTRQATLLAVGDVPFDAATSLVGDSFPWSSYPIAGFLVLTLDYEIDLEDL